MATCPECAAGLDIADDVRVGEVINCAECQAELEVITRDPIELALAPEVEEDWGE